MTHGCSVKVKSFSLRQAMSGGGYYDFTLSRCLSRDNVDILYFASHAHWLAVWLSGNALASINVVALRQTRLVLGWVTVCGRVNHFGT